MDVMKISNEDWTREDEPVMYNLSVVTEYAIRDFKLYATSHKEAAFIARKLAGGYTRILHLRCYSTVDVI